MNYFLVTEKRKKVKQVPSTNQNVWSAFSHKTQKMLKIFSRSGSLKEKEEPLPVEAIPFPPSPRYRIALIVNGNRYDSTLLANGIVRAAELAGGAACHVLFYDHREHDKFASRLNSANYDGIFVRISNSGFNIRNGNVLDVNFISACEAKRNFDDMMKRQLSSGKPVWPRPSMASAFNARDIAVRLKVFFVFI
jgi:hypothetical protein